MKTKQSKAKTRNLKVVREKRTFKVVPGHQHANIGDTVVWRARSTGLTLLFPNENLFGQRYLTVRKGGAGTLRVRRVKRQRVYPYAVYCRSNNDFARGGTSPRMIID